MKELNLKINHLKIDVKPQLSTHLVKVIRFLIKGFRSSGEGLPCFNYPKVERSIASLS